MKVYDLTELSWVRASTVNGEARRIRTDAGLTQAELAAALGVAQSTVTLWESGKRRPSGNAALRYASTLRSLARATSPTTEAPNAATPA